jgi:hypothetical protein
VDGFEGRFRGGDLGFVKLLGCFGEEEEEETAPGEDGGEYHQ